MAEHGGKRTPPARTPSGGPGRFSRRNERTQPVREPDIDQPDLEYGDRQRLAAAQRLAPLPQASVPSSQRPRLRGETPSRSGGRLPPWLFETPTSFPDEPVTAGLDMGPGPGSDALALQQPPEDVREQTLAYLAQFFDNPEAQMALAQLRNERAKASAPRVLEPMRTRPEEQA